MVCILRRSWQDAAAAAGKNTRNFEALKQAPLKFLCCLNRGVASRYSSEPAKGASEMVLQKRLMMASAFVASLFFSAYAAAGPIVYIGLDPGDGHFQPETGPLIKNATTFAGGSLDPKIGYLEAGGGFSTGTLGPKLTAEGFTDTTLLTSASLAVIDLSIFDMLYFGPTTDVSTIADYVAASAAIASYVAGSGGLVVEPEVQAASSWSWVPDAALIGHSGSLNVGTEAVSITAPLHPVMSGLTSTGLSGWGFSVHSTFSTAAAAGYTVLATDASGTPVIITKTVGVPEPTTVMLLGVGLVAVGFRRKRKP